VINIRKDRQLSRTRVNEIIKINSIYKTLYNAKNNVLYKLEQENIPYDSKIYDLIDELEDETLTLSNVNKICEKISKIYIKFMNKDYKKLVKNKKINDGETDICKIIGNNMTNLTNELKINQSDFAKMIGLKSGNGYLNKVMRGEIAISVEKLNKIATALDVEMSYLLEKH